MEYKATHGPQLLVYVYRHIHLRLGLWVAGLNMTDMDLYRGSYSALEKCHKQSKQHRGGSTSSQITHISTCNPSICMSLLCCLVLSLSDLPSVHVSDSEDYS